MVEAHEKRETNRAPLVTKISWTLDDRQWREDSSQDVSPTGMMLRTQEAITPGSPIKLRFKLPNLKFQEPIEVSGEAVRVVQRNGRQIGVGLRFLSIRSHNYQVVQEFVCRIMGLPLIEEMTQCGSHDERGYSFTMERLAREADAKAAAVAAEKEAQAEALARQLTRQIWWPRAWKTALLLTGLLLVQKGLELILAFAARLQGIN